MHPGEGIRDDAPWGMGGRIADDASWAILVEDAPWMREACEPPVPRPLPCSPQVPPPPAERFPRIGGMRFYDEMSGPPPREKTFGQGKQDRLWLTFHMVIVLA